MTTYIELVERAAAEAVIPPVPDERLPEPPHPGRRCQPRDPSDPWSVCVLDHSYAQG